MADNTPSKKTPAGNAKVLPPKEPAEKRPFARHLAALSERAKVALNPLNIIKYLLTVLWKPVLFFVLLFSLFFGGAYAASHYKLIDAKTALDFEWAMPRLRGSNNAAVRELLPAAEWATTVVAAAGELIQTDVERREAINETIRIREEQERIAQQERQEQLAEQERLAQLAEQERSAQDARQGMGRNGGAEADERRRTVERGRQEAELKQTAEQRQQELNRRAGKLAAYYAAMQPSDAVKILANMENDEIILILSRMPDAAVSQIMVGFAPERAAVLSQSILKLRNAPDLERMKPGVL